MTHLSITDMTTSLSDIRPGDTVILRYSTPFVADRIATVDRVTKTQIIIGLQRFRVSDGRAVGSHDRWHYWRISPATPDTIAEVERQQQLKRDQERAYQLAAKIGTRARARDCANVAAAIPHLVAALAVLN